MFGRHGWFSSHVRTNIIIKNANSESMRDMITDLKQMIKTLQATVDAANKREEALIQERDNLKDEITLLRKKL